MRQHELRGGHGEEACEEHAILSAALVPSTAAGGLTHRWSDTSFYCRYTYLSNTSTGTSGSGFVTGGEVRPAR